MSKGLGKKLVGYMQNEKGAVIVLVAVLLVVLLGFAALAVDVGYLYSHRANLSKAVDAAALAGVQDLPDDATAAYTVSESYANNNGVPLDELTIQVSNNDTVMVTAQRNVDLFFARVLGINDAPVGATATAKIKTKSGGTRIVPWGIQPEGEFKYGEEVVLKISPNNDDPNNTNNKQISGWYWALGIDGSGADIYKESITNGCQTEVNVGDTVNSEQGNMVGPTQQGVMERIDACTHKTVEECIAAHCSRLVTVPIVEVSEKNVITIKGFAKFYLLLSSGDTVTGKFVKYVEAGNTSDDAPNYGLYSPVLID